MRTASTLFVTLVFALPTLTFAAGFGFPREPLWLSSTSAREGDHITMYAAVYNSSESEMEGTVTFLADGEVFDTKDVQLPSGGSSLVTDSWPAVKGTHTLSARFESGAQKDSTGKITVTVTAAPPTPPAPPSVIDKTVSQATDAVQNLTNPSSPVTKIANAVLEQTENAREAGADFVRPYASDSSSKSISAGFSSAVDSAKKDASFLDTGLQLAAAGALYAFDTKWLFYVLLVALLFFTLRTLKRWVNRPRF